MRSVLATKERAIDSLREALAQNSRTNDAKWKIVEQELADKDGKVSCCYRRVKDAAAAAAAAVAKLSIVKVEVLQR